MPSFLFSLSCAVATSCLVYVWCLLNADENGCEANNVKFCIYNLMQYKDILNESKINLDFLLTVKGKMQYKGGNQGRWVNNSLPFFFSGTTAYIPTSGVCVFFLGIW